MSSYETSDVKIIHCCGIYCMKAQVLYHIHKSCLHAENINSTTVAVVKDKDK